MKIIILGEINTGKTTVAQLITEALERAGLQVKNGDIDVEQGCNHPHLQDLRLAALRDKGLEVVILQEKRASAGAGKPSVAEQVGSYCDAFELGCYDHEELARKLGGEEEWEGVRRAGFFASLEENNGEPPVIVLLDDGTVEVLVEQADGARLLEDRYEKVTADQLAGAVQARAPLHLERD